jgi:hypothetical protein
MAMRVARSVPLVEMRLPRAWLRVRSVIGWLQVVASGYVASVHVGGGVDS